MSIIKRKQIKVLFLLILTITLSSSIVKAGTSYDSLFKDSRIVDLLVNESGRQIIQLIHATCKHQSTKIISRRGNILKFQTNYKGWVKKHKLIWMIELNDRTILSDFNFISDTNRFPSARFANQMKNRMIKLIKDYYRKYGR